MLLDLKLFDSLDALQVAGQYLASLIATIGTFSDGMHYGWTAPFIEQLKRNDSVIPITDSDVVQIEGLYLIGGLIGLPFNIPLPDRIGRRYSILVASSISFIGWLTILCASRVEYLYLARILIGIAGCISYTVTSMYIAEISHPKIRGFLTEMVSVMELLGVCFIYIIGPFVSVRIPSIIGMSLLATQMVVIHFIPESPYYLLCKNKRVEAKKALSVLRKADGVDDELDEISKGIQRQKLEKGSPKELFTVKSNRKALLLTVLLNGCQHFAGISVMVMNFHSILEASGTQTISKELAAIIFCVVLLVSTGVFCFLVDKFGRKTLLVLSSFTSSFCLFVIASHYSFKEMGSTFQIANSILLLSAMVWGVTYELGLGSTPIIMIAELFPVNVKALGMAFSEFIFMLFAAVVVYIYNILHNSYGLAIPFYFLGGCTIVSGILSVLYVPETKGKTLEEIQLMLRK